jgi:hypothetical protein
MKILDKVQEIFNQHELKPIQIPDTFNDVYVFLGCYPEFSKEFESKKDDSYFLKKYRKYIPEGHYGFSIGTPIVPEWCEIIDEILELCIKTDPNFEICQVKIKFGTIHFNVYSDVIEDTTDVDVLIMNTLHDKALIY